MPNNIYCSIILFNNYESHLFEFINQFKIKELDQIKIRKIMLEIMEFPQVYMFQTCSSYIY